MSTELEAGTVTDWIRGEEPRAVASRKGPQQTCRVGPGSAIGVASHHPEEARARYRERDAFLREKFHIQVSGFTTKPVEAFVAMAARREPPLAVTRCFVTR